MFVGDDKAITPDLSLLSCSPPDVLLLTKHILNTNYFVQEPLLHVINVLHHPLVHLHRELRGILIGFYCQKCVNFTEAVAKCRRWPLNFS